MSHPSQLQVTRTRKLREPQLTFQNVKADSAQLVNVGMVDLGHEADLGRSHRVLFRQKQLQGEGAAFKRRLQRIRITINTKEADISEDNETIAAAFHNFRLLQRSLTPRPSLVPRQPTAWPGNEANPGLDGYFSVHGCQKFLEASVKASRDYVHRAHHCILGLTLATFIVKYTSIATPNTTKTATRLILESTNTTSVLTLSEKEEKLGIYLARNNRKKPNKPIDAK